MADGYGLISSVGVDPIEKKPLHHYYPGEDIFSIGSWGCNFACAFCQNWTISQQGVAGGRAFTPRQVVDRASASGGIGIAYTYNEPLVAYEFVSDCAVLAREAGLKNVLVTNGFVSPGPAADLLPLIDALNVDVKSMDDAFYVKQCRGHVKPVLELAEQAAACGCHVEITNLVIPGLNDETRLIEALVEWIASALGESTPLHLSAYHPQFKTDVAATTLHQLEEARTLALKTLPYVYLGNVCSGVGQDTACPHCGKLLVKRRGYATRVVGIIGGVCAGCGCRVDLITRDCPQTP
jgi:pyruvate formate lyase activating enzyme